MASIHPHAARKLIASGRWRPGGPCFPRRPPAHTTRLLLENDLAFQVQQAWAARNSGQPLSPQQQLLVENQPSWHQRSASKGGTEARDRRNCARDPDGGGVPPRSGK
ncbi:hypothetical protein CHLRE_06g294876v5 [Chlamydomonas reinhardtii]|uniref:Uncharacterized protein n=1 Tax=Chlamydomonas reinhardtii TaxID=3055 RepID=A0A2K3DQJ7_CHLRE|nr:uncharacterized protein CHLRE_06g294876v5 [Chlamydomonas reinhardtii]PNW82803.1 hypothetical protein CHLRE_06g294876v5 [Chlamydomonas reinhardtii]